MLSGQNHNPLIFIFEAAHAPRRPLPNGCSDQFDSTWEGSVARSRPRLFTFCFNTSQDKRVSAAEGMISSGNVLELQLVLHDRTIAEWADSEEFFMTRSVLIRALDASQLKIA
jgi:hypothetical protein